MYRIIYYLIFVSILYGDRFIYTNTDKCNFYGTLENDTWVITPYRYRIGTETLLGVCQPYTGYIPVSNNHSISVPFNATKMIMSDDWACIYFYKDIGCQQPMWQDCLSNQFHGKTNITLVSEGVRYPFTRKCYCWLKNINPCYT